MYGVESDLFVELRLRRAEWDALRGTTLVTEILGEEFQGDIPADTAPGDVLTYEGEGLEGDDGNEGEVGDLHLIPIVR